LFREGDPSDSMYVIKSGKIAITKSKGSSEVILAELGPGDMLGEMSFFDSRPRSAGARAAAETVIIELPFKSLNAQFKTFPEWLKAIVRTVNNHLRNANLKIKNLEKSTEEEHEYFSPHLVTRLIAVLALVAARYGEVTSEGIDVPPGTLRKYTIQVFQLPTAKMQKLMEILQSFNYMKSEELGEGRVKITMYKLDLLLGFVDFYNDWLFKAEDKKITIFEKEMPALRALIHFGKKETPDAKGEVRVNLTMMQAECVKELSFPFSTDDVNSLVEKKQTSEKLSTDNGIALNFNFSEIATTLPYWELIHIFKKIQRGP
jgi:CRP/FNR family cyclic AMP-dependent transcriptional regulator